MHQQLHVLAIHPVLLNLGDVVGAVVEPNPKHKNKITLIIQNYNAVILIMEVRISELHSHSDIASSEEKKYIYTQIYEGKEVQKM